MKISLINGPGLQLIPQTPKEEKELKKIFDLGHLHLCCKAFYKVGEAKKKTLILTPSLVKWKMDGIK